MFVWELAGYLRGKASRGFSRVALLCVDCRVSQPSTPHRHGYYPKALVFPAYFRVLVYMEKVVVVEYYSG